MIQTFLNRIGEYDEIMTYCFGINWGKTDIKNSHIIFNEKLDINLKASDDILESANLIKVAWVKKKRNDLINKII